MHDSLRFAAIDTFGPDLLKCPLNRGCKNCLLTINTQRLPCAGIKFHVVKDAKEALLRKAFR